MRKYHHLRLILLMAALLVFQAAPLWAADAAAGGGGAGNWRGPGFYLSIAKMLACWLLFLAWVLTTDWVSRDAQAMKLDYLRWNPLLFGTFLVAWAPFCLIPQFWVSYPLLVIAYLAPLAAYVVFRNKHVHVNDKVLTAEHLRWAMAELLDKVGIEMAHERRDPNLAGAPVGVFARGGPDDRVNGARLLAARQSPGLPEARKILCDGLANRATAIMLDFTAVGVAVRYMIDGVWLRREGREREDADPALQALKLLCGMKPQRQRERQEGQFGLEYAVLKHSVFDKLERVKKEFKERLAAELTKKLASAEETGSAEFERRLKAEVEERTREKFASPIGPWTPVDKVKPPKLPGIDQINALTQLDAVKCLATMAAQATQTGERVLIQFETKATHLKTLTDLGMRDKMQEQLKALLDKPKGLVLFSAIPGGGLRTTLEVVLHGMDRFVREFISLEAETNRYPEVENIPVTTYNTAEGQTPAAMLTKVFRNEPQVVVVRDLIDAEMVSLMCQETVAIDRLLIGSIRAKDCAEALLRVLILKVPPQELAPAVSGVLCQRLVRKLCDKCKVPYVPSPEIFQQLGIPVGRIRAFYRPRQESPDEEEKDVCPECGGIGYRGLTAIFELVVVDDAMREVLATTPKHKLLIQAARKAGMRSLQEECVLLVARGVTSLAELMRVVKK